MSNRLKDRLKDTALVSYFRRLREKTQFNRWVRSGRPTPPPHRAKQLLIERYARQRRCGVLVETGTYKGDMLHAMCRRFRRLYSIELQPELHARAKKRFANRPHVQLLQGDSGERISDVLKDLKEPAVFWLDGHYSAGGTAKGELETPIARELSQILNHPVNNHVILIDDARLFDGTHDYPTLDEVRRQLTAAHDDYDIVVEDDVIAVTRRAA